MGGVAAGDWERVGKLLRRARGRTTVVDAAHRAGVSRGWWQNVEAGAGRHLPDPAKLAAAAEAVGANLDDIFRAAGYDPEPFRHVTQPHHAAEGADPQPDDAVRRQIQR